MHILLVDTTAYKPLSPLLSDALDDWCKEHPEWTWSLADENRRWSFHGGFQSVFWREINYKHPDILLVMKGSMIHSEHLKVKDNGTFTVCYATDDPWNESVCKQNVRDCIPLYDLYVTTKRANVNELYDAGAKEVHYLPVAYKPSVHYPEAPANDEEREKFSSDICIIGGADAERIATVKKIVEEFSDKEIVLYGGFWERDPDTAPCHRGFAYGRDYRLAISGAKVCVNLLRRANRDQHNMRTFEIPACGGLLLTEQTPEHTELGAAFPLYRNDNELLEAITELLISDIVRNDFMKVNHWVKPHTYHARLEQLMAWIQEKRCAF